MSIDSLIELERCRRDPHYFIFSSRYVRTKDEHDMDAPVKPFYDSPYLHCIVDALLVSGRLIAPPEARYLKELGYDGDYTARLWESCMFVGEKSRQIVGTWIICAYLLWRAKFRDHQLILVQSKREDDAANLVFNKEPGIGRISFLESNLPEWLRTVQFPRGGAYGHLYFPNGSHIWAIPEGGDIIRSNTSSVIFSDEAAFQPEFGSSLTAALPSIKGGGQYVCISSAEPGTFQELVEADEYRDAA